MKSVDYWEKRALAREEYARKIANGTLARDILPSYDRAAKQLTADVQKILHTYMKNSDLSEDEARKLLNIKEPKEVLGVLRNDIKEIKDPVIKKQLLSRINAPAYAARISRAEALREQIYVEMGKVADKEIECAKNVIKKSYEHTYYRSIFDIQRGTGYAFSFAELPKQAINSILNESWSGKHYSERVWRNTHLLAERAQKVITSGIISGKSISCMARQIDETMNDGKYAAVRLVRTESNRAHNAAELEAYREEGVGRYRFLSVLDKRTCVVCGRLDGKAYGIDEAKEGVNYPPMHPNDRCTTVGVYDDECVEGLKRRARNPVTGKNELIPRDMTFSEWKKSLKKTVEISAENDRIEVDEATKAKKSILEQEEIIAKAKIYAEEISSNPNLLKSGNGYNIGNYVAQRLGYDKLPQIVSAESFKKLSSGKDVLYRGVTDAGGITAHEMVERFKFGEFYCGRGIYGNGTYTDIDKKTAEYYAYNSGNTHNGEIMEMLLSEKAKVVDFREIFTEFEKTGIPRIIGIPKEDYQIIIRDVGTYAAIKGYDAIALNGFQNKNHVVILNRGKVIIKE